MVSYRARTTNSGGEMKKLVTVLLSLAFAITLISCEDPECKSNYDCASWQECSGKVCVDKPPKPKKPSGETVVGCNCLTNNQPLGTVLSDDDCESGSNVLVSCNGCCAWDAFGYCIGFPWGRVCQ